MVSAAALVHTHTTQKVNRHRLQTHFSTQTAVQRGLQVFQISHQPLEPAGSTEDAQNCQSPRGDRNHALTEKGNIYMYICRRMVNKWSNLIFPPQAELLDAAAGVFIRFRLGGVRAKLRNIANLPSSCASMIVQT